MSVATLSLRADISALTASLGSIPGITENEAKRMAIALEKGFLKAEKAAKEAAQAMRQSTEAAAKAAEAAVQRSTDAMEAAQRRLQDLAAAGDPMERLTLQFQRQKEEIAALAFQTGDHAAATKATTAATKAYESELAKLRPAVVTVAEDLGVTAQRAAAAGVSVGDLSFRAKVFRAQLADIGTTLAGGMNPFVVLAQQGPDVAQALMGTNSATAVLKESFGGLFAAAGKASAVLVPLTLAVAAAGTTYLVAKNAAEEYAEANGRFAQRLADAEVAAKRTDAQLIALNRTIASLKGDTEEARLQFDVLNGIITDGEAAYKRETEAVKKQYDAARLGLEQVKAERASRVELNKERLASGELSEDERRKAEAALGSSRKDVQRIQSQIDAIEREREERLLLAEGVRILTDAKSEDAAQKSGAKDLAKDLKDAERAAQELAAAMSSLNGIIGQSGDDQIDGYRKLGLAAAEQLRQIEEISAAQAESAEAQIRAEQAKTAVLDRLERDKNALRLEEERAYQDAKAMLEEEAFQAQMEREQKLQAERAKMLQNGLGSMATFAGGISDLMAVAAEENAKTNRKLALQQFRASKAAAVAEATVNGAVAITMALRQLGPIAGALATTGIVASTAAQIAVISKQKPAFDRGGMIQGGDMLPDQVPIRAMTGEAVLNRGAVRALGGESGVNALNRGQSNQPTIVAVPMYRHFGRFIRDDLSRNGVLSAAISGRATLGTL